MWRVKVFTDSSSSSSDSDSTELPHPKRKRSARIALQDTTKGEWERKVLLKGEKKKCQSVKDLDTAELSLQSVINILLHYVLRTGAVKQATLYSGFIQYQSSSPLFFQRY